jgi:8-oxo-dGTP pyrophosphatase MutT (NUDIX family)
MAMPLFRVCSLLTIFTLTLRRTFAFRSTKIALQTTARKQLFSLATSSSSSGEDLPTNNPPQQQQQHQQQQQQQQKKQYPRAAVSVALRCFCGDDSSNNPPKAYYLLIRRGNEPNKGEWALPGGKLEWGESTLDGAKRELSEEVLFDCDCDCDCNCDYKYGEDGFGRLVWCPEPYATADSITEGFHYLIAVCFAEWKPPQTNNRGNENENKNKNDNGEIPLLFSQTPPSVTASDDAIDARWWSMDEIMELEGDAGLLGTKGFVQKMKRTELLYQQGVLSC